MNLIQPLFWGLTLAAMLTAASGLSLLLAVPDSQAAGLGGHAAHAGTAPQAPNPDSGPWLADAVLAASMQRIEAAVAQAAAAPGSQEAAALGRLLQEEVAGLIEDCRLAPDADAALHALLVPLLADAALLRAGGDTHAALSRLQGLLAQYRRDFSGSPEEVAHAH